MSWLDPHFIIQTLGLFGIFSIVILESGVFFAFFLPGDSLLFIAGIFAAQGYFSLVAVVAVVAVAATLGGIIGYLFGKKIGRNIFLKEDSLFFKKAYVARAERFAVQYGAPAVLVARFVPIVRTFMPIVAGVGDMAKKKFYFFNMIGALLWAAIVPTIGYFLGSKIPHVESYILPIVGAVIVLSFVPFLISIWAKKRE